VKKNAVNDAHFQKLGQGCFGDVYLGTFTQPIGIVPVAVKTPKNFVSSSHANSIKEKKKIRLQRKLLRDELKIMAHIQDSLGGHANVLRLVGAITTSKEDFCILTEYCEWGSLDHFLRNKYNSDDFENELLFEKNQNDTADSEEIWRVEFLILSTNRVERAGGQTRERGYRGMYPQSHKIKKDFGGSLAKKCSIYKVLVFFPGSGFIPK
jgi:hypothetical protein